MKLKKEVSVFLDLIRGISAQLVLVGHLLSFYKVEGFELDKGRFVMQNFGVVVFFILSGFLIMHSVSSKKGNYGFADFFIDRFSRIFIAFIPALFFIFLCDIGTFYFDKTFIYQNADNVKNFIGNIFMLQDHPFFHYGISKIDPDFNFSAYGSGRPLWSVAVEWWIYMFFGFMAFKKLTARNAVVFLFLLIVPLYNMTGMGNGLAVVWFLGVLGHVMIKADGFKPRNTILVISLLLVAALFRLRMNRYEVYDLAFSAPVTLAIIF